MIELKRFKLIMIFTLIAVMIINHLAKTIIIALIPEEPIDAWGYALAGCFVTGLFYAFDYKSTRFDWLYFALFIFFFSIFLTDFDDFYNVTIVGLSQRSGG